MNDMCENEPFYGKLVYLKFGREAREIREKEYQAQGYSGKALPLKTISQIRLKTDYCIDYHEYFPAEKVELHNKRMVKMLYEFFVEHKIREPEKSRPVRRPNEFLNINSVKNMAAAKLISKKEKTPLISRFYGISIYMSVIDPNDKPYILVLYNDYFAAVNLNGEIVRGKFPITQLSMVNLWSTFNNFNIRNFWNRLGKNLNIWFLDPLH